MRYCVRGSNGETDYFESQSGLKQGCKLSPILFSYFINSLLEEISANSKHGVQFVPNTRDISALLFADDMALLSDTAIGLQNQLNFLLSAANRLGLIVDTDKTKIVVYRLGGHLARHERWCLGEKQVEVVREFKYLGNILSTKLSASETQKDLVSRAKGALLILTKS